jgi:sRNA-binding carbon storage regulator CsrA
MADDKGWLVLTLKDNDDRIYIEHKDDVLEIKLSDVPDRSRARIAFRGQKSFKIWRKEVYDRMKKETEE